MATPAQGAVTVVGSANVDLLLTLPRLPVPGETALAESAELLPGGKGANQAVAAARLGVPTAFVGAVGPDDGGDLVADALAQAGVDTTELRRSTRDRTGQAVVQVDATGANVIVVVPGANRALVAGDVAQAVARLASPVLLTQLELEVDVVAAALTAARGSGAVTVLNAAPAVPSARRLLAVTDVLVVNAHEAATLLDAAVPASPEDAAALLDALRDLGPGRVVVTLGPEGLVAGDGPSLHRLPAHPTTVRDTTGAGDAFCGALAAALARGSALPDALDAGLALAARTVAVLGAQAPPPEA